MAYTCTVTVDDLNIRSAPNSQSDLVATYPNGTVLSLVEVVNGENVNGNAHWGHSVQGHYYWMGGTDDPNGAVPPPSIPQEPHHCGDSNPFENGQCTWWASERYHQVHNCYVPWTTNSDAYQWADRARDFHWNVSTTPHVGDIMVLAKWVQGAEGAGHVGIVEQILPNGNFVASSANWNKNPKPTNWQFHTGQGVDFVSY